MPPQSSSSAFTASNDRSFHAQALLLIAALLAVFLAGGPNQGGMGLFLAITGGLLLLRPPARKTPWIFWGLGILLVMTTAMSLLPSSWTWKPEWSANLRDVPGLILSKQLSADPRSTFFWALLLLFSSLTALYSLGIPVDMRQMRLLALLAVGGCSLYAIESWGVWQAGWYYPFFDKLSWTQATFGFFPNRNHTAGFLVTGAILTLGLMHHGVRRGKLFTSIIAAGSFALLTSMLLFYSVSRGGLVFLLAGSMIWVLGLGKERSRPLILGGGILLITLLVFFLFSGSGLLERFKGYSPDEIVPSAHGAAHRSSPAPDARFGIARDTLSIIADHPVTGTGLGTYRYVYPFYADKSLRDQTTALHAENDWLTLCTEGGIPSLIVALSALFFLSRRMQVLREFSGHDWPIRWAFLSAFFAELLHGMVDVPLHKPELGWWVLLLGGIGFGRISLANGSPSREFLIQRNLFRVGGVLMLLTGVLMILAQWRVIRAMPPYAPADEQRRAVEIFGNGSSASSVKASEMELRNAIARYPMSHELYYQLGVLILNTRQKSAEAAVVFNEEQALWPRDPNFVFQQGKALAPWEPLTAADYWNEALARQWFLDRKPTSPLPRTQDLYRQMISSVDGNQALLYRIPAIGGGIPGLRMIWLTSPQCDGGQIAEAVADSGFMKGLTEKEQRQLFDLWWQKGEKKSVLDFLNSHPEYRSVGVTVLASSLAASGQPEQACRLVSESFGIRIPQAKHDAAPSQAADADEPAAPLAAAEYHINRGEEMYARKFLADADPNSPETLRLYAQLEMLQGNWANAYAKLLGYLHASGLL
jgi:hypothetical protein